MLNRISLTLVALALMVAAGLVVYLAATPHWAPTPLEASTAAQQATNDPGGITVSGTGKVQVKPDLATTSIGVEITAPTLADAMAQATTKMNTIIDKIKSLGVADKDIQTSNFNVTPITNQPKDGTTPKITGYRVNNQLNVIVRKLDDLGKILDAAVTAGANNVYGITFGVADPATSIAQARAAAVKDAQDKATQLAKAANVTLGKVISINEGGSVTPRAFNAMAAPALSFGGGEVPIQSGSLDLTVSVDMRFAVQ